MLSGLWRADFFLMTRVHLRRSHKTTIPQLRDAHRTIQQESYEYSDPVTQFLEFLFVHYDFDGAQQQLKHCEEVIDNDFFLTACKEEFVENARLFIFEVRGVLDPCLCLRLLKLKPEGKAKTVYQDLLGD